MRKLIKFPLVLLSLGLVVTLVFFGWSAKAKDDATFHLANGVQVTPVEVQSDDMALAMDTRIWKFDVKPPAADKPYQETVAVYQHGRLLHTIGGFGLDPDKWEHLQVTICISPVGDNLVEAQRIKYAIRGVLMGLHGPRGSLTDSGSFANPVKGLDGGMLLKGDGNASNQVVLFSGHNHLSPPVIDNTNITDISIVFQVEALPNLPAPAVLGH